MFLNGFCYYFAGLKLIDKNTKSLYNMETTLKVSGPYTIGQSGKMELMTKKPSLPLFSRVYNHDGEQYAVFTELNDSQYSSGAQKIVRMGEYYDSGYLSSAFSTVDQYSRPISKKFGIGWYWDDKNPDFRFEESEVKEAIKRAEDYLNLKAQKAKKQAEKDAKEREQLPARFPYLSTDLKGKNTIMNNIRAMLKHNFPGVKFSVTNPHGYSCEIGWNDGPTVNQVDKFVGMFEDHKNDQSGDFRDYSPSNFNRVFGGMKYVFTSRSMSEETRAKFEEWANGLFAVNAQNTGNVFFCWDASNLAYRLFAQSEIKHPDFEIVKRAEMINGSAEQPQTQWEVKHNEQPEQQPKEAIKIEGLEIIDYSDKAIALIGDTKPIKDQLKAIGGRFNPSLRCGAGWIFPKSKRDQLLSII